MPSYTAHTIMARDVYKKLKNKISIYNIRNKII